MICKDCGSMQKSVSSTSPKRGIIKPRLLKNALGITTSMLLAFAGHNALATSAQTFNEYVRVVHVEPVYRNVTIREPQRVCRPVFDQRLNHRNRHKRYGQYQSYRTHSTRDNEAAFVSGVISRKLSRPVNDNPNTRSNNVTHRDQRGNPQHSGNIRHSQIYNQQFKSIKHNKRQTGHTKNTERLRYTSKRHTHNGRKSLKCTTTLQTRTVRRHDGYDVTYRYRGHRYQTHTAYHPGDRLAIQVTLNPHKR